MQLSRFAPKGLIFIACLLAVSQAAARRDDATNRKTEVSTETLQQEQGTSSSTDQPISTDTDSGHYVEVDENIMTATGEVVVDPQSGASLPEEANDGELEGGDKHTVWNYTDQQGWSNEYPLCKGKNLRQSPIVIMTDEVVFKPRMQLQFIDYHQQVEFELKNTHHSVSLMPISSLATPTVKVNWVSNYDKTTKRTDGEEFELNEFELQEIHFHWGDGLNKGSEHQINDKKAAAEMHMVHYRKGLDKTQIGSVNNSVLVVGVLIESDEVEHKKLESLIQKVEHVNGTDLQYKDNRPEFLINLLPDNHHSFYTYNGSLTTPPCYEVVTWVIMSEPVYMSQEELTKLANLEAAKPGGSQKIAPNYRVIQPLLDRPVYASFNTSDSTTYQQDRIGGRRISDHKRLSEALDKYWKQVNAIGVSFKKAYKKIEEARKNLMRSLHERLPEETTPKP